MHISIALDTSLNVTEEEITNLKLMINMFIKLLPKGQSYYLTFGQFNRKYQPEFVRQVLSEDTITDVMQRVYTFKRESPRLAHSQYSLTPQTLPLHTTIKNLHQKMKTSKTQGSSQVVLMMFDKEPLDILLADIALREAKLDGVHFVTIPIGIDSYPDTFTYSIPLYSLGDVNPGAMDTFNRTLQYILPEGIV
jgi:hypothetical protein